jgi:hypothetical protein
MKLFYGKTAVITFGLCALTFLSGAGCNIVKKQSKTAVLLKTEDASQAELISEVNRFAKVDSMRAKVDLKFEDNSFAEFGSKEIYRQAPGEIVVQRPGKIMLKVQVPVINSDVAHMTSDGTNFRVAILQDNASGKFKKFVKGTNNADYSRLQRTLSGQELKEAKASKENVNAFANLRPQHFTDAMLVRPTDDAALYTQSTIYQVEEDQSLDSKSPIRTVTRGYYMLDEFARGDGGKLTIARRFWFDRVGGIRLARQQIFDAKGEIESDIVYGRPGSLSDQPDYANLPLEIIVTRPKERYAMRITYAAPGDIKIGKKYPETAFLLQNTWNLEEVDLDQKLREAINNPQSTVNKSTANRAH